MESLGTHFIQTGLWDRLLKLPPHFFRQFSVGNLVWRSMTIQDMFTLLSGNLSNVIFTGIFAFFYVAIMTVYSPLLSLLTLSIALLGLGASLFFSFLKVKVLKQTIDIQGTLRGSLLQMIAGVGKLRVAGAEKGAFAYWASLFSKWKFLQMKAQGFQNGVFSLANFLPIISMLIVYVMMIELWELKSISLPTFLAFNIAFASFNTMFYPLFNSIIQLANIVPLWEQSKCIFQEPIEEVETKVFPGKLTGKIEIDEMTFGYDPHRPPILENISFSVAPGEFIGITGPSGCGKSTLVRLLIGFETPLSGAIYYNNQDLKTLDPKFFRKQLGIVFQGEGIMGGTLYDNLVAGGIYSDEEIDKALDHSGFKQDLASFPMGFHTFIPANGETLSGGQKQRLLLARALLGKPSVLIFDEATSALDNITQEVIRKNIDGLHVTRIVVAHRLSTLRKADRIYVLEKGKVAQMGTFEELGKQPGLFATMLERQRL